MQIYKYPLIAAIIVTIACGVPNTPEHGNALDQIKENISDTSYKITKLTYVNGLQEDVNHYVVGVTYTRTFKVSSNELAGREAAKTELSIKGFANLLGTELAIAFLWGQFSAGDSFDEACEFNFLKTEKGWVLTGINGSPSIVDSHKR